MTARSFRLREGLMWMILAMVALVGAAGRAQGQAASAPPADANQLEEKNDGLDYLASWDVMIEMCSVKYPELKQIANDFWGTRMPKEYREQLMTSQAERYKRVKAEVRGKLMARQDEILSQCYTMFRR
jgi:hypothetical protein